MEGGEVGGNEHANFFIDLLKDSINNGQHCDMYLAKTMAFMSKFL